MVIGPDNGKKVAHGVASHVGQSSRSAVKVGDSVDAVQHEYGDEREYAVR
jgi:hypothetical protein